MTSRDVYEAAIKLEVRARKMAATVSAAEAQRLDEHFEAQARHQEHRIRKVRKDREQVSEKEHAAPQPSVYAWDKVCDCCQLPWVAHAPTNPVDPRCPDCREHGWYPDEPVEQKISRAEAHEAAYKATAESARNDQSNAEKELEKVAHSRLRWREALARLVLEHEVDGSCWCVDEGPCRTWAYLHQVNRGIARQVEAMLGLREHQLDEELRARTLEQLADAEDAEVERRVRARLQAQSAEIDQPS